MSITSGQQLPLMPNVEDKASMEKWIRDLLDYLRRLNGRFTADSILNLFIEEGDVNNVFQTIIQANGLDELVALADGQTANFLELLLNNLQTSTRDATKDHDLDVERVSNKLTYFLDISTISGYTAGNQQVLTHSASGGLAWVDTAACL